MASSQQSAVSRPASQPASQSVSQSVSIYTDDKLEFIVLLYCLFGFLFIIWRSSFSAFFSRLMSELSGWLARRRAGRPASGAGGAAAAAPNASKWMAGRPRR